MALKVGIVGALLPVPGVNYTTHLTTHTTKPITSFAETEKMFKGKAVASAVGETVTEHPGVFTDGREIRVSGGRTINLGNYESARIDVALTVPCTSATMNEAYDYATEWVSDKINDAVKQVKDG